MTVTEQRAKGKGLSALSHSSQQLHGRAQTWGLVLEFTAIGDPPLLVFVVVLVAAVDRFYIALFSALEQTHCARMSFYTSD